PQRVDELHLQRHLPQRGSGSLLHRPGDSGPAANPLRPALGRRAIMTPAGHGRDIPGFLLQFFGPPNQTNEGKDPRLTPWIDRLRRAEPLPTVLPCVRGGQIVDWYGVAFDERQWRSLGEDLTAFIGPSFTTFRGQRAPLDGADPIDAAVDHLTDG